jgi:DNA topoisomerase-6 subunit B
MVDIHKDFAEHSIAEFFKKNRQMLGYSGKIRSLTTVIHEFCTNSLDACEEAGIPPDVFIQLDKLGQEHYKVTVEDNGPGIPKKLVGKAFGKMLAGTKFHRFQQARGQQGIGGAGCVMYGQVTTGKPTKVVTSSGNGTIYECRLTIDIKSNEAKIMDEKEYSGQMRGTRIETELKDVLYQKSDQNPDEYLRRTALANPHVKLTYINPDSLTTVFDRAVDAVPPMPKPTQPHPKGITVDDLLSMASITTARTIKSFLTGEFSRMSSAKAEEIAKAVKFDMDKRPKDMNWEEAEQVVSEIKKMTFIAPPTDVLIPINENHLEKALENILQPEFKSVLTRPPAIYSGGVPFIVEVALAYGGKAGISVAEGQQLENRMEIMRFANRVPLLFDTGGCGITKAIQAVEWKRYGLQQDLPLTVLVNFTSIHVPYTGAGKQAVIDNEDIIKEIRLALMDAGRKLGLFVSGQRKKTESQTRLKTLMRYIDPIAEALHGMTDVPITKLKKQLKDLIEEKYAAGEIEEGNGEEEEVAEEFGENGE